MHNKDLNGDFENTLIYAQSLDKTDPLADYRSEFHIPVDKDGNELVYLCGNSLGLMPKNVTDYVNQELTD